jgi:hypothetical protein
LEYWKYSGYGGAVYCDEDSTPEFTACEFTGNRAEGGHTGTGRSAGAGKTFYPSIHNDNTTGENDDGIAQLGYFKLDRYGGAVYAAERSQVSFTECVFTNNATDVTGPEFHYKDAGQAEVMEQDESTFGFGGSIAFEDDAEVTLEDCVFEDDIAHFGGSIYAEHATLKVSDSNFASNTATFGGALYYVDTDVELNKATFTLNSAEEPDPNLIGDAGSIFQGGAVFAFDSTSLFTDLVVMHNSSGRSGGGFYVTGGNTTVKNALITSNNAGRDGAGFSANWYSTVDIQNCTFSMNEVLGTGGGVSQGGAIFAGYQSYVDIIDSILWNNSAGQGQQIAISTGFEFDPVPSTVSISYSDVKGNRSVSSVFVDSGCTLNWDDASILFEDPLFVDAVNDNYHLSQPSTGDPSADLSPCVDTGSDLASALGLDKYTTAYPEPIFDADTVDMGYHYPFKEGADDCAWADLAYALLGYQLDGVVDINDLVILAEFWLENQCDVTNRWCQGSDLNFDSGVDLLDFAFLAGCWGVFDYQQPLPNPSQWEIPPKSDNISTDSIYMEAVQATDNWIGGVEYYFRNLTIPDGSHDSGWWQSFDPERPGYRYDDNNPDERAWIYIDSGLTAGPSYTYEVLTRDVGGNETGASTPSSGVPGVDNNPPLPNPSEWAVGGEPIQIGVDSIGMEAAQATDVSGVEYLFVCLEDNTFSSGWQPNTDYEVVDLVLDVDNPVTYTFAVKTRDLSEALNETALSDPPVAVEIIPFDDLPPYDPSLDEADPLYYTAKHAAASPRNSQLIGGRTWHVVTSIQMEDAGLDTGVDPTDVEYRFVNTDTNFYSSGNSGDPDADEIDQIDPDYKGSGPDNGWRNVDNVAGLRYPDGTLQVPWKYWADRGLSTAVDEGWQIEVRDRVQPIPNESVPSVILTIEDVFP